VIRSLAEGVRVFAISIVIAVILGTGEFASLALIVCLTLIYTFEGGMTAVIWTDVIQMALYVFGAVVSFFVILNHVPGGWQHVVAVAGPAGKLQVFDFQFALTPQFFSQTYTFWAGLVGGCFLTTASHGTEQLMVQRLLAARDEGESRKALFASWAVIFVQFALFLAIGLVLYVFYQDKGLAAPQPPDRLYPAFVWQYLPPGIAGLVMAAVLAAAMSNLSAALNSLSSTTIIDFWQPLRGRPGGSDSLKLARGATVLWGLVLVGIGALASHWGPVLETGLTIASIAYGGLLGVFLLGVLTRRVGESAAIFGMACGLCAVIWMKLETRVAWTWYVSAGASITFLSGWLASWLRKERARG
jgi:SSS family solute:Na+ symporter